MYVDRGELEIRLKDALDGNKYILIHGESGNGKTWLYKKVLAEEGYHFTSVNLSNAVEYENISDVFADKLGNLNFVEQTGEDISTTGGVRPGGVGVEATSKIQHVRQAKSAFFNLVSLIRMQAGRGNAAIALDNYEQIIANEKLLAQLRAVIISADDDDIAAQDVRILLIGVPGNLKELISKTPGATPILNRIFEIPEVARIPENDALALIKKGLFEVLSYGVHGLTEEAICQEVFFFSDGIAQQIHEICLAVAQYADDVTP